MLDKLRVVTEGKGSDPLPYLNENQVLLERAINAFWGVGKGNLVRLIDYKRF